MEDNRFNTRRNVMKLTTLPSFTSIKGGYNHNVKDVYFVRCIGYNNRYMEEVKIMDEVLTVSESNGTGKYLRWNSMPRLCDYDQIDYYTNTYTTWINNQKRDVATKYIQSGMTITEIFNDSLQKVEHLFTEYAVTISDSIKKNFMIKLLYWIDTILGEWVNSWNPRNSYKIVFNGEVKQQEYLFFYLLTTLGFDVMLMNPVCELNVEPKLLELSDCIGLEQKGTVKLSPLDKQKILRAIEEEKKKEKNQEPSNHEINNQEDTSQQPVKREPPTIPRSSLKHPNRVHSSNNVTQGQNVMQGQNAIRAQEQVGTQNAEQSQEAMQQQDRIQQQGCMQQQDRMQQQGCMQQQGNAQHQIQAQQVVQYPTNAPSTNQRQELSFEELAQLASSVVMIAIHDKKGNVFATGSGIMISEKGYILTNNHVASGGYGYSVRIEDDDKIYHTNEVIKYNSVLDLALIRIDRRCKPLPIYNSNNKLVRGQKVVAIGSPLGLFNSVSNGIISGFRKIDDTDMIQFTAPISHGSSGGALLNMYGEVIGISTAGYDDGQNINLAVDYKWIIGFLRGFI